jgi:hypothetical protein
LTAKWADLGERHEQGSTKTPLFPYTAARRKVRRTVCHRPFKHRVVGSNPTRLSSFRWECKHFGATVCSDLRGRRAGVTCVLPVIVPEYDEVGLDTITANMRTAGMSRQRVLELLRQC